MEIEAFGHPADNAGCRKALQPQELKNPTAKSPRALPHAILQVSSRPPPGRTARRQQGIREAALWEPGQALGPWASGLRALVFWVWRTSDQEQG